MYSKNIKLAVLLASVCSLSHPSSAGVSQFGSASANNHKKVEPAEERQRPPGDRELPATQNGAKHYEASSVIKCWQYGRLIVDERDWKPSRENIPGSTIFHSQNGRYSKLRLLHFGDAFCLMKQTSH